MISCFFREFSLHFVSNNSRILRRVLRPINFVFATQRFDLIQYNISVSESLKAIYHARQGRRTSRACVIDSLVSP